MIVLAYLRDGRVHASHEAYEGGDGIADYQVHMDLDGEQEITTTIRGDHYRSLWCWSADSKRQFGVVPLIKTKKEDPK